jgi:flagella synthesis protein FlgN
MSKLQQIVESELAAVQRFIALLRQEQEALRLGQDDALLGLVEQKSLVADDLTKVAAQRNALLASSGFPPDRPGIENWLARAIPDQKSRSALAETWGSLTTLAAEARELNRLNGDLIQIRMRHNTQALEALLGASRPLSLYGPDGQARSHGSRRINDAV